MIWNILENLSNAIVVVCFAIVVIGALKKDKSE